MARKKKGGPPKGFTIGPSVMAEQSIRERLNRAAKGIPGSRSMVHVYKDGSVDGEIVVAVERGKQVEDVADDIKNALGAAGFSGDVWVSMGLRYIIQKDDEIYRKNKGMNEVGVNFQRAIRSNIAEEFLILTKKVAKGLKKKYRRKAAMVFVRFHWNPDNKQPSRY